MFELKIDEELEVEWKDEIENEKRMKEPFVLDSESMSDILYAAANPSDLILAQFADVVKSQKTEDYKLPKDWVLLATGSSPKIKKKNKMYFGAAFVHHKERQVVVAHHEINNDSTKNISAHEDYINSATTFMNYIREVVMKSAGYNLNITGYRLGGWLAQITAFTVKYLSETEKFLKKDFNGKLHPKTVVFDSPGARDPLKTVLDIYYERYRHRTNVLDGLNITVYVSIQNEINICGLHLGKVYSMSGNNDEEGMNFFIDALKKDALEICEIVDWPKNEKEFSNNKNKSKNDPKDDSKKPNSLSEKSHRQAKSQLNDKNISSHFKNFAEDELIMLYKLHIIQEQTLLLVEILIKEMKICFPMFEIDSYKRMILCKSRKLLDELTNCLKQLMRYLEAQFRAEVEKQIKKFLKAADLIYRAEGLSFLGSSPRSTLNFADSIGLWKFLSSETLQVLQVYSQDGEFEMLRLQNIFSQIKNSKNLPPQIQKYTGDNHYTFLNWQKLQKLKIFGSPINQNDLMIIDGSSSQDKTISEEDVKPLIKSSLKKLVFILSKPTNNNIFDSIGKNLLINRVGNINLKNLLKESQNTVFQKKKLIFTGNKGYSFQEFMGENSSVEDVNELLSSDLLKNIAFNEDYVILLKGTRPTLDLPPQMPLYKTNIKTSKEFILSCVQSLDTNILIVVSGVNYEELETGPGGSRSGWEELALIGKDILHQSHKDAELSFYRMCIKNPDKSVYLLAVSGEDIHCKMVFNPDFYLPRIFFHKAFIDLQKFVKINFADDLFVTCNKEGNALLVKNCTETKILTEIATKEEEAQIIKKNIHKNIHFVKINKIGNENELLLEWRYSHGSAEKLRPCMTMDTSEPIDEATFALTERNIVILADDPGTGKTTTLERLSRQLESEWVIYIRFKYFKTHIESLPNDYQLNSKNVACFLLSECTHADNGLDKKLLEYLLERNVCSRRIVVMFAGFDELDDYKDTEKGIAKEKIISLLRFLKNKPAVQIFLTARKYVQEFLELELGQISTFFKGISKQQQVDLLVKFWLSRANLELRNKGEEEKRRLEALAGKLLPEVKRVLSPDNDCFMGVPLHMQMLAEHFSPQHERHADLISAPNLFETFMNLRYETYFHEKILLSIEDNYKENLKKKLTKNHRKLGFKTYFPKFYDDHEDFEPDIKIERLTNLNRHGLLQSKQNGEFQFVYQANAEYCCAYMIVHFLKQQKSDFSVSLIKEILVPKILLLPDYKAIRWFMNAEINELELNSKELCRENIASVEFVNQENETALLIAKLEKNEHIVKLLSGSSSEST